MTTFNPLPVPIESGSVVGGGISSTTESTNIGSGDLVIYDNYIILNNGEVGPGITKIPSIGGFGVDRGLGNDVYQCIFDENGSFKAGLSTNLKHIGLIPTTISGILKWDASTYCFNETTITDPLTIGNLIVGGTQTINGETYTWPSIAPLSGQVLTNSGSNMLVWSTPSGGGGGGGSSITDTATTTSIETERGGAPDTIFLRADTIDAVTITQNNTSILNECVIGGGISFTPTNISTGTYNVLASDSLINYIGTTVGNIILPNVSDNPGRILIIHNRSNYTVTLDVTGVDTIDGSSIFSSLNNKYDHIKIISDGIDNWIVV